MRIAVAGASGTLGRLVTAAAELAGHQVVPLSRSAGVDLLTGSGVAERLEGVHAVVDALNTATQRRGPAEAFFATTSRTLLDAGTAAGVAHHVVVSIIGVDRVDSGYYFGKRAQEGVVRNGEVPWTILRSSQWHEFAQQALGFVAFGPVSMVPRMLVQPVAAREVAQRLVSLAAGPPSEYADELAGPERHQLVDLARQVNERRSLGRRIVPITAPGRAGRAMRDGALLPEHDGVRGSQSFTQWLDDVGPR
ncbi:MAG: NAD(P)H-binding protein [Nocardioides sp.]